MLNLTWVGWLEQIGKRQAYQSGQSLRERYSGFLSPEYSLDEIYALSSDIDRTINIAQALLAGLFPPEANDSENSWNPLLPWNPIPVHVISASLDNVTQYAKPISAAPTR
jgi:hypothetical protein